ncbi:MAG: TraR/DksA C4-type zinc finger protein [Phycisphaerae bacterium]
MAKKKSVPSKQASVKTKVVAKAAASQSRKAPTLRRTAKVAPKAKNKVKAKVAVKVVAPKVKKTPVKAVKTVKAVKPAAIKVTKPVVVKAAKPAPLSAPKVGKTKVTPVETKSGKAHAVELTGPFVIQTETGAVDLTKCKSGLLKSDLNAFRKSLLEKRQEILGDVGSMESEAFKGGDNLSNAPIHMADVGSDSFEQEFTLGLIESERQLLRDIHDALKRIEDGIYGICLGTGKPIGKVRLEATPWAKFCIEHAQSMEKRSSGIPKITRTAYRSISEE